MWTRKALAELVFQRFGFDIEPLWTHLQKKGELPSDLPDEWDPIGGEQGALQHLKAHSSIKVTSKKRPIRPSCRACGVAKVALGCLWAIGGSELPHAFAFVRELNQAREQLKKTERQLRSSCSAYIGEQSKAFGLFVNGQRDLLVKQLSSQAYKSKQELRDHKKIHEQNQQRLAEIEKDPGLVGVNSLNKIEALLRALRITGRAIRVVEDDVLVDLRGVLDLGAWNPSGMGKKKMVTLVETTLHEEGFSWKEIAALIEEEDSREAVDRVRARVEGRGGRSIKKRR